MPAVTATQADPAKPGAEDWRPSTAAALEAESRAEFLKDDGWPGVDEKPSKGKPAPEPDDDDDLEDDEDADIDTGDDDDDDEEEVVTKKPAPKNKAKPAPTEKPEPEEEPDDDSDLDEDEDDDKPDADPAVARGMQKLQKQEQRMRAQFAEKETRWQADIAKASERVTSAERERDEWRAKYERLGKVAKDDPASVLEELGVDDFDYAAKQAFVRSKAGADPANKESAARLRELRELKAKQAEVERKLAEREKAEAETAKEAKLRGEVESYLGGVVKSATSVKAATCIQKLLAADPQAGLDRLKAAAGRLYQGGEYPDARAVVKEAEKQERAMLRRYGINPRTLAAAPAANGNAKPGKPGKPADRKAVRTSDDELKMPSRDELLAEDWTV